MTEANQSFSEKLPALQLAVDSTSLGAFKKCPRFYQYRIIQGFVPRGTAVDLEFGIHFHFATEGYDHRRAKGMDHETALHETVRATLIATWDRAAGRPWITEDSNKNRLTLIRTLVWYLDTVAANDTVRTLILANGKPAVELSFRLQLPIRSSTGEFFILCGHLDRVGTLGEGAEAEQYILDKKTTRHTLGPYYWDQFNPNNQFSLYNFAGKIGFSFETKGIICDAAQVAVGFSRFERRLIPRTPGQVDEWYRDLELTLESMNRAAYDSHWPMNDTACYRCDFQRICSKDPASREVWLKSDFGKRVWDPLKVRGDV